MADVGFAVRQATWLTVAGELGYGFTESVLGDKDAHHRGLSRLSAALPVLPFLSLAAGYQVRLDAHDEGPLGAVDEPRLTARVVDEPHDGLGWGGELLVRVPGADFEDRLAATTLESRLLARVGRPRLPFEAALNLGFRLDNTAQAVEDAERLRLPARVGLVASDANALLTGVALSWPVGGFDVLAAFSWDVQLGAQAASPAQSPMRLLAGARYWPHPGLHFEALLGGSPSARPQVQPELPLYPIEPRLWLQLGATLYFARAQPTSAPPAPPRPQVPSTGSLRVAVRDAGGTPVGGAAVSAGDTRGVTDAKGDSVLPALAPGRVEVVVEADGYEPARLRSAVAAGRVRVLEVALERALPAGQIRGTVRAFDGTPLRATVIVEPIGLEVESDAEGRFAVDVAPGEYTVTIRAPGYRPQQRPAQVEEHGVTVIIVDLGAEG